MYIDPPVEHVALNAIPLAVSTLDQATAWILGRASKADRLSIVTTVNLQFLRIARADPTFATLLREHSALNLIDGWPVAWMARRKGSPNAVVTPGSNLTRSLLTSEAARALGIYLLGDSQSTINAVVERGEREGWRAVIRGAESPPPAAVDDDQKSREIVSRINESGARILLVAFGAPRQEKWLWRWSSQLTTQVGIGIGGSLKFIAWPERRAPLWMQRNGLEWLHRVFLEPIRLAPLELLRLIKA
jgi:N-acetylglucosaminyldiphosphoundecaprenol N-acetyl-beta-D-mannosaminyltransferase